MSNMSYCRFQNTLADLEDCNEHIGDTDLSAAEEVARQRLIEVCREIIEYVGDDDDEDYADPDQIDGYYNTGGF